MRALITGGAGFIGSHLADALIGAGHHVVVLDDLSTGSRENVAHLEPHRRFECVIGSISDDRLTGSLVQGADVVFHLAAAVGVKLVVDAPIHTIETNVNGTEVVLRHARRHRTRVLVASTSEVYGKSATFPFREDADLVLGPPTKCRWGYAASKLIDEFLALAYWKEHQVPTTVVRFFNSVGPRQSSRYGMVLPNFVRHALSGQPLIVHGDGRQTRSFTWVGDVIAALMALATEQRAVGEVFNVGNDREISIADLAARVRTLADSDSEIRFTPHAQVYGADFEDMSRRVPDISKLRRLVGYQPKVQLDEIITRTIDYWRGKAIPDASRAVDATPVLVPKRVFADLATVGSSL
jgi:UDP-glucose 4-epimerase